MIVSYNFSNINEEEIQSLLQSGQLSPGLVPHANAKLAGLKADRKRSKSAATAATAAPAAVDRSALDAASAKWVEGQNADIDKGAERSLSQGMSNMIGSGLAGTTAVGGMTASVGESATRAKGVVAGESAARTEGLALQYAGLAQGASESALNRQFQASEGAANRASSERMSSSGYGGDVRQGTTQTPGLDAFGRPMHGSAQQKEMALQQQKLDMQQKALSMQDSGGGLAKANPNLAAVSMDTFKFWD